MKTKENERGLIEKREILFNPNNIAYFKYFLLVIDKVSCRQISTYGPFDDPNQANDHARLHGIVIG